jgi:hypothetical protein
MRIETLAVLPHGSNYLVQIRVTNRGAAVAGLAVEGVLREGTETVETSAATMREPMPLHARHAVRICSRSA